MVTQFAWPDHPALTTVGWTAQLGDGGDSKVWTDLDGGSGGDPTECLCKWDRGQHKESTCIQHNESDTGPAGNNRPDHDDRTRTNHVCPTAYDFTPTDHYRLWSHTR